MRNSAAALAAEAGRRLRRLRRELTSTAAGGAQGAGRRGSAAGAGRPAPPRPVPSDAVLSGGGGRRPGPARRRPGVDHRSARRHPRVLRGPDRLGGARRALGGRRPRRRRGGAARARTSSSPPPPPPAVPARDDRPPLRHGGQPQPAPGHRDRGGRARSAPSWSPMGSAGSKVAAVIRGEADALRARRRAVRVGLGRAGRGRPGGRAARLPARRLTAALQPAATPTCPTWWCAGRSWPTQVLAVIERSGAGL